MKIFDTFIKRSNLKQAKDDKMKIFDTFIKRSNLKQAKDGIEFNKNLDNKAFDIFLPKLKFKHLEINEEDKSLYFLADTFDTKNISVIELDREISKCFDNHLKLELHFPKWGAILYTMFYMRDNYYCELLRNNKTAIFYSPSVRNIVDIVDHYNSGK
jgi:hypothetical protein